MNWITSNWLWFVIGALVALVPNAFLYLQTWLRFCHCKDTYDKRTGDWPAALSHLQNGQGTLVGLRKDGICYAFVWSETILTGDAVENILDHDDTSIIFPPLFYVFFSGVLKRQGVVIYDSSSLFN